ncbi:MAG: hypothetical protein Hyperionvirus5_61 [Hyperionvirus sp.]|uniref:Leucine-rich repeat protein n=1 Tax=Hyperionvirus sp. TaxID=2487770 RepID=A0A3G5A7P8_9VIRU|nr:MAG: hypothetical protein Hyperionvirus5_61 [Hyperionvirus sp.]
MALDKKSFLYQLSIIPPYVLSVYFDIYDLIILKRTNRFFHGGKLCKVASPIIYLARGNDYSRLHTLFPKARLVINGQQNRMMFDEFAIISENVTSIDLSTCSYGLILLATYLPAMENLTSLTLRGRNDVETKMLDSMTKLVELDLSDNKKITGPTLQKLTSLKKLNLDHNSMITDYVIESLPLTSLSLIGNKTITPFILTKLKLTHLHIWCWGDPKLKGAIIQCTTVTDLHIHMNDLIACGVETIIKMTQLRKLAIADPYFPKGDYGKYLTNLTQLTLEWVQKKITIPTLPSLRTLIIKRLSSHLPDFGADTFPNLSHLEIDSADNIPCSFNFDFIRNLTHLNIGARCILRDVTKLKKIQKLKLRSGIYDSVIDISQLVSLTSLEISDDHFFEQNRFFAGSESLESLTINVNTPTINSTTLEAFPNLKYLCLRSKSMMSCSKTRCCFQNLHKLYMLKIERCHNLDERCIALLEKRGVLIRYFTYPDVVNFT